jgi:hypothetical protein
MADLVSPALGIKLVFAEFRRLIEQASESTGQPGSAYTIQKICFLFEFSDLLTSSRR